MTGPSSCMICVFKYRYHNGVRPGVSNTAPGGPVSCRVQLQPQLNTPEPANQGRTRHTRNFQAGVLRQVGAKLFGDSENSPSFESETLQDSPRLSRVWNSPRPSLDTPVLDSCHLLTWIKQMQGGLHYSGFSPSSNLSAICMLYQCLHLFFAFHGLSVSWL